MGKDGNKSGPEPRWLSSGRGIFCMDAGFQLATMPLTVNWQEDTARIVDLLNKGEKYEALLTAVTEALVEVGPSCIVCGEDIETDTDPCDEPCSGRVLRCLVHEANAR